jgi:glycosyltransferase involved in cell wall biosynthesis
MRIAFVKPDHGVVGGFEAVVAMLERIARDDGHDVRRVTVDMRPPRAEVAGLDIPRPVWDAVPEYFPYLRGFDGFARLELHGADVVVSTQPPSFAVDHPRHLSLFYHHHRVFYDLEETYLRAGFAPDETVHRRAGELIRELDAPALEQVGWFLAGSATVARRLERYGGATNATVFHAGHIARPLDDADRGDRRADTVLCVGRLEFPKRTELAIAAAHLLPQRHLVVVGTGGREGWARALDHRLATTDVDPATLPDHETWCNTGHPAPTVPDDHRPRVTFAGRLSDADLAHQLATARCAVAPALDEDYGLTALEAMAAGVPIIVCADGGGLTELVDHEQTGLVVAPTAAAIAAAVERLCTDDHLAREMGANGRERAATFSWERAAATFREGLERVAS